MSDLKPEHVEAVARAIDPVPFENEANLPAWKLYREGALRHATYLLTSTDPAVHAALLAALVRAGVLVEERWRVKCTCGKTLEGPAAEVEAWTREHDDSPLTKHLVVWSPPAPRPWKRRYVTSWEETCD